MNDEFISFLVLSFPFFFVNRKFLKRKSGPVKPRRGLIPAPKATVESTVQAMLLMTLDADDSVVTFKASVDFSLTNRIANMSTDWLPLSRLPLFIVTAGVAFAAIASSSASAEKPTGAQPSDATEAEKMIAVEREEELLDEEAEGLTIPPGGPRPALIIVMGPASW